MKNLYLKKFALAFVAFAFCSPMIWAQSKAHIYIKKNQNGEMVEETREFEIAEGQDIETILKEMGVLDEFGKLKDGQSFQITIDKFENGARSQDFQLRYMPGEPLRSMPPIEGFALQSDQPFLGVMLKEVQGDEASTGVMISEVIEGTAAETAGLQAGDIIVEIDDQEVNVVEEVIEYIGSKKAGDEIKIQVLRDGNKKKIKAELGERAMDEMNFFNFQIPEIPEIPEFPELNFEEFNFSFDPDSIAIFCPDGFKFECDSLRICQPFSWNEEGFELKETPFLGVTPGEEDEIPGVLIGSVIEESSAENMGILEGDIITSYNGNKVNNFDELADLIGTTEIGSTVTIELIREGKNKSVNGEIGTRSVSAFKDFRIFHDFKGMDEDGNYNYDYEFDIDNQDIEQHLEELIEQLEMEKLNLNEELERIRSERESMVIRIEIEDITPEEVNVVNENASPKLKLDNDLVFDQISFFPNPGNGLINLNFNLNGNGKLSVLVYDSNGNKVYHEERGSFGGNYSNTIDISDQADGTYYLQIMLGSKTYSKKLIKGE
jgi:PDZ domain/Secretion system C-terminal sorting domain